MVAEKRSHRSDAGVIGGKLGVVLQKLPLPGCGAGIPVGTRVAAGSVFIPFEQRGKLGLQRYRVPVCWHSGVPP